MTQDQEAIRRVEELLVSGRVSTMMVCIHDIREGGPQGEIYNCYLRDPVLFEGAGDMVLKLDQICDWIGSPKRTAYPRFLSEEMEARYRAAEQDAPEIEERSMIYGLDRIPFQPALRAREVLIVYVKYRQNASIQGSVRGRLTRGKVINFRSGLELMRMMEMVTIGS